MEERKFFIHGKTRTIMTIILFCFLLVGAACVSVSNIIAGMCMEVVLLMIVFCILWKLPIIIVFNNSYIQTKTFFGKVKKIMYWSDLKKIISKKLFTGGRGSDNYCIFISTEEGIDFRSYEEAEQEDKVVVMSYFKGIEEILKKYTKIDIENMI